MRADCFLSSHTGSAKESQGFPRATLVDLSPRTPLIGHSWRAGELNGQTPADRHIRNDAPSFGLVPAPGRHPRRPAAWREARSLRPSRVARVQSFEQIPPAGRLGLPLGELPARRSAVPLIRPAWREGSFAARTQTPNRANISRLLIECADSKRVLALRRSIDRSVYRNWILSSSAHLTACSRSTNLLPITSSPSR